MDDNCKQMNAHHQCMSCNDFYKQGKDGRCKIQIGMIIIQTIIVCIVICIIGLGLWYLWKRRHNLTKNRVDIVMVMKNNNSMNAQVSLEDNSNELENNEKVPKFQKKDVLNKKGLKNNSNNFQETGTGVNKPSGIFNKFRPPEYNGLWILERPKKNDKIPGISTDICPNVRGTKYDEKLYKSGISEPSDSDFQEFKENVKGTQKLEKENKKRYEGKNFSWRKNMESTPKLRESKKIEENSSIKITTAKKKDMQEIDSKISITQNENNSRINLANESFKSKQVTSQDVRIKDNSNQNNQRKTFLSVRKEISKFGSVDDSMINPIINNSENHAIDDSQFNDQILDRLDICESMDDQNAVSKEKSEEEY